METIDPYSELILKFVTITEKIDYQRGKKRRPYDSVDCVHLPALKNYKDGEAYFPFHAQGTKPS